MAGGPRCLLDCRDARLDQMIELPDHAAVRSARRERAKTLGLEGLVGVYEPPVPPAECGKIIGVRTTTGHVTLDQIEKRGPPNACGPLRMMSLP